MVGLVLPVFTETSRPHEEVASFWNKNQASSDV